MGATVGGMGPAFDQYMGAISGQDGSDGQDGAGADVGAGPQPLDTGAGTGGKGGMGAMFSQPQAATGLAAQAQQMAQNPFAGAAGQSPFQPPAPALGRMMAQGQMQRTGANPMNISASQIGPGGINNRATYDGGMQANPNPAFQGGLRPAPNNYRPPMGSQTMLSPNTVGRSGYQPANTGMPVNARPGMAQANTGFTPTGLPKSLAMQKFNAQPQQRAQFAVMGNGLSGPTIMRPNI